MLRKQKYGISQVILLCLMKIQSEKTKKLRLQIFLEIREKTTIFGLKKTLKIQGSNNKNNNNHNNNKK